MIMEQRTIKRFFRNPASLAGTLIILCFILVGIFGPWFIGDEGLMIRLDMELKGPGAGRLGFAENGIDVLTSLIHGARISLLIALTSTLISLSIGIIYGAVSGFFGNRIDAMLMRIIDILLAFPGLLLAIYIAAILSPKAINVVFALCITGWVGYARVVRAQVLSIKNYDYVTAAKSLGAKTHRTIFVHIIPNILGPIIVQASFGLASLILAEAALSFLGLGVPPGTPSWGALLDQGVSYLFIAPHLAIFPGICIAITVLGFNFFGDGLRDVFDVKNR
jgi:peptide/nickel transport system permease protein